MATLTFSLEELLDILKLNNLLPKQIAKSEVKDNNLNFTIQTENFLLPMLPVTLKFKNYSNNTATFELNLVSSHFNKALGMFGNSYQSKMPDYVKLDLPEIHIDIEKILEHKKINGIRVKDIHQKDDLFSIITEKQC
jgi:hypothetical protein